MFQAAVPSAQRALLSLNELKKNTVTLIQFKGMIILRNGNVCVVMYRNCVFLSIC